MKKACLLLLTWVLCLTCCLPIGGQASGASASMADTLITDILRAQCDAASVSGVQELLDTTLTAKAGAGSEWYAVALCQLGGFDLQAYGDALSAYLADNQVRSAVTRQKYALTLLAAGQDDHPFIASTMEDSPGEQGIMSIVYALHLMNNGLSSPVMTAEAAIGKLADLQLDDGGFAITGTAGDVDVTAMTVQALTPNKENETAARLIDDALQLLSKRQQPDGSYMSYGISNTESIAQVWIALSGLGIDALSDARFIKNGATLLDALMAFQLPDGQFSHKLGDSANPNATVQALHAAIAYRRMQEGKSPFLMLDKMQSEVNAPAHTWGYKPIAALCVLGISLICALVLLVCKKKSPKNYILLFLVTIGLITFIFTTDFQSADGYYTKDIAVADAVGTVTLSIRCDRLSKQHTGEYIPKDGVVLADTQIPIAAGDTVYTVLTRAAQTNRIHMESSGPDGMIYIAGLAHLYELDFGDLSGWVYTVNGQRPSMSCDQYVLNDGDTVLWQYTLALGNDL